jgi:uncharacterized protein YndB with AHSA1/START domain
MAESRFVYVSYIRTTPAEAWRALTHPEFIRQYWFGVTVETTWEVGSPWSMTLADGRLADSGEILEFEPEKRLAIKWRNEFIPELNAEGYSRCVMEIEPVDDAVKLTVTHSIEVADSKLIVGVSGGWPKILSNLKSLLETGAVVMPHKA